MSGEVIGITSAKLAAVEVEGIGYAISTETAIPIIEALVTTGYVVRPWLGVSLYTVDEGIAQQFDLAVNEGALVTRVVEGSPATMAGLEAGDVIVSMDDKETLTAEELIRAIRDSQVGQRVEIVFWRGDIQLTIEAVLVERPQS
ncbi:Serine protease Do-like HtrA [subsurface metagenome]